MRPLLPFFGIQKQLSLESLPITNEPSIRRHLNSYEEDWMMRELPLRFLGLDRCGMRCWESSCLPGAPMLDESQNTLPLAAGESESPFEWESLWIDLGGEG
jgi:hypothetical protein